MSGHFPCGDSYLPISFNIMFGINPSDLPWWGWFLRAVGAGIMSYMSGDAAEEKKYFNHLFFYAFGIGAIICVLMGIACLVNLRWGD
jgi:hypothetical protein